jgi:chitin deacetylase
MLVLSLLLHLSAALAGLLPHDNYDQSLARRLPASTWYHHASHPIHALFKRGGDGQPYAAVGSPGLCCYIMSFILDVKNVAEWASAYPTGPPDISKLPADWVNALNAAVAAGTIPNISQSQQSAPGTNPFYPNNQDPTSPQICSGTYKCRIATDIWDAPEGYFGTGFDDGPQPVSTSPISLQS